MISTNTFSRRRLIVLSGNETLSGGHVTTLTLIQATIACINLLQPWMYQFVRIQTRLRLLRRVIVEGQVEMELRNLHFKFEAHFVLECDRSVRTTMGIGRSSSDFGKGKENTGKYCTRQFCARHHKIAK